MEYLMLDNQRHPITISRENSNGLLKTSTVYVTVYVLLFKRLKDRISSKKERLFDIDLHFANYISLVS